MILLSLYGGVAALGAQQQQQRETLRLTTKIVGLRYCSVGEGLTALQLRLQLRYANVSDGKLILYRGKNIFYQVMISRELFGGPARKFELHTTHSRYFDELREEVDASSPGRVFVTLSPGASHRIELTVIIPVAGEAERKAGGAIAAGDYFLQIAVSTWYESRILAEQLRRRWQREGHLHFGSVTSAPISLMVEARRADAPCRPQPAGHGARN